MLHESWEFLFTIDIQESQNLNRKNLIHVCYSDSWDREEKLTPCTSCWQLPRTLPLAWQGNPSIIFQSTCHAGCMQTRMHPGSAHQQDTNDENDEDLRCIWHRLGNDSTGVVSSGWGKLRPLSGKVCKPCSNLTIVEMLCPFGKLTSWAHTVSVQYETCFSTIGNRNSLDSVPNLGSFIYSSCFSRQLVIGGMVVCNCEAGPLSPGSSGTSFPNRNEFTHFLPLLHLLRKHSTSLNSNIHQTDGGNAVLHNFQAHSACLHPDLWTFWSD